MTRHPSRPTMHDVARKAGVSQMTVSRVLRDAGYVSDEVKERVHRAAAEIGYIQNRMASVQRGAQNPMVGVILPTLKNSVFTDVLAGINDTLSDLNIRPVFGVSEYQESQEEILVRDMLSWQPCGLILSGVEHTAGLRRLVQQSDMRVAEIMDIDGDPISAAFGISHQSAGVDMARHMIAQGYRRIALLGSHGSADTRATKRFDAFKSALATTGAKIVYERIASAPSSMALGRELTQNCLAHAPDCDAIYYANDDLAAGGLMHCLSQNVSVPQDVALAGFNDLPFLSALPQKITTTRTPRFEMGAMAARFVATGAPAKSAPRHQMDAALVPGDTT